MEPNIVNASPIFSITIASITHIPSIRNVTSAFYILFISFLKNRDSNESFAGRIHNGVAKTTVKSTQHIPIVNPTFAS